MIKRFLLLILIIMLVPVFGLSEEQVNLLTNPGFEELGEDGLPVGWFTDAYVTRDGVSQYGVTGEAKTGGNAVFIMNYNMNDARFAQTVEVKPNTMYRLSGWVKAENILDAGRGANLSVAGVYAFSDSLYDTHDEWTYLETYGITGPAQTEITVFARVGGYSGESEGGAAFDDLALEVVTDLPAGVVADAWYVIETVQVIEPIDASEESSVIVQPFWPWLIVIAVGYACAGIWLMRHLQLDRCKDIVCRPADHKSGMPVFTVVGMLIAALTRMIVALNVDGYQVDVNCFTAWGNTMANVGPTMFYQSNWCDYTPGYIYVMGLNGIAAQVLAGFVNASFVHKLIPMACDLLGAWLIYQLAVEHQYNRRQGGLLALLFAFNPAVFLNSAAWCQIDSVLCVGLMLVAYFAIHRKWAIVLPMYVLCILVKPQALMLGFLGLTAIVMELVRNRHDPRIWKQMGIGLLISVAVALLIILPFSPNQESGSWLIDLYKKTLASYPHATVNTANIFYLFDANWDGIENPAGSAAILFFALLSGVCCIYFYIRRKDRELTVMEPLLTVLTLLLTACTGLLGVAWSRTSDTVYLSNVTADFVSSTASTVEQVSLLTRLKLTMQESFTLTGSFTLSISGMTLTILAGILLAACITLVVLLVKKKSWHSGLVEPAMMAVFTFAFTVMLFLDVSWSLVGVLSMAMAFALILPMYIRSGKLDHLPLCGAVIFLLLYVFGIKMHERYLFPALFLLGMAYAIRRDRRILLLLIGTSCVLFVNEGVILDNSLRLGSSMGHLNADNVALADSLSVLNVAFAVVGLWLCHRVCVDDPPTRLTNTIGEPLLPVREYEEAPGTPLNIKSDAKLHLNRKDTLLMLVVTAIYSIVTLTTLGSTKAPQTAWKSSAYNEQVYIDLGKHYDDFSMMFFCQVSYNNFAVAVSDDIDSDAWSEDYPVQMAEGMCFSWQYLDPSYVTADGQPQFVNATDFADVQKLSGRYVRINPRQYGLVINELIFKDAEGNIIPGVTVIGRENANESSPLYSEATNLLDEQDTLEGEPGWWNSTYFDEIYHARTAFELLNNSTVYEWTHPPLGKIIMSWFIGLFGMTPFGWRFGGALCGILMLPAMYLLVKQLTKRTDMAFVAMTLMSLDCMHLTQTQIATIDSYPVLFIILSYFFMLRFMQRDIVLVDVKKLLPDLALCGFFMGCGFASKWIGAYAGVGLAVLFFWSCFRHLRLGVLSSRLLADDTEFTAEEENILTQRAKNGVRRVVILCLWCLLFFVAVPVIIYLLAYADRFADREISGIFDLITSIIQETKGMLSYHSTPRLGMDHAFYSPWYEWPLMMTPMYYASAAFKPEGMSYAIFCFGNPWVWLVGLSGIAYTVYRWAKGHRYRINGKDGTFQLYRDDWNVAPAFILIGLLAQFLPWVLVPRGTYIYHYFASVPFLILGTTLMLHHITLKYPIQGRKLWIGYLCVCLVWFIILFPYASGITVPEGWLAFIRDYPFISRINNYWQNDLLVRINTFLENIPIFPHVYFH